MVAVQQSTVAGGTECISCTPGSASNHQILVYFQLKQDVAFRIQETIFFPDGEDFLVNP